MKGTVDTREKTGSAEVPEPTAMSWSDSVALRAWSGGESDRSGQSSITGCRVRNRTKEFNLQMISELPTQRRQTRELSIDEAWASSTYSTEIDGSLRSDTGRFGGPAWFAKINGQTLQNRCTCSQSDRDPPVAGTSLLSGSTARAVTLTIGGYHAIR